VPNIMKVPATCTTSWDDGHPLDLRLAELLSKYDLTGTFYVPFENSRKVMTRREMTELLGRFELGSHTVHHTVLTEVSDDVADAEIRQSKSGMEDLTGLPCETFCFPKGRFRRRHLGMVRRAGYQCARTVELLSTGLCKQRAGISLIPTTVQVSDHGWAAYAKNCAKRLSVRNLANSIMYARSRNWVATARTMLQAIAQHGGVFHLWGHSWEIDAQHQWVQLEAVLREMHALRFAAPCVTNSALARLSVVDSIHPARLGCHT